MKFHDLKILSCYYFDIIDGNKTFEIRKNDRNFEVGDIVHFNIIDSKHPNERVFKIVYVLKDVSEYGLQEGYCIFGIKPIIIVD